MTQMVLPIVLGSQCGIWDAARGRANYQSFGISLLCITRESVAEKLNFDVQKSVSLWAALHYHKRWQKQRNFYM